MAIAITILGANSAIPTAHRFPSAQLVDINRQFYLVDCGEGTQMQLRKNKIKFQRIKHIFISHMHGDHYYGIFGLIGTMHLLGRVKPLTIFAPPELKQMMDFQQKIAGTRLSFELTFVATPVNSNELIYEDEVVEVYTIPMIHRIPCNGFLFKEKLSKRKLLRAKLEKLNVPIEKYSGIKDGLDFTDIQGVIHPNAELTDDPKKAWSYAYCTDTRRNDEIVPIIKGVDVLYHEATFLESERERAWGTFHSTAADAASIANLANVGHLIIGHYSARYSKLDGHLAEAKAIFPNTSIAVDGQEFDYP